MSSVETEAAPGIPGRTRKPRNFDPDTDQPEGRLMGSVEIGGETSDGADTSRVYGYPVKDGFARIMVFADPGEGNKTCYFQVKCGDHPTTFLAKNRMHVLPMCLVNNILDSSTEFPVDDLSDERNPTRSFETRARLPHSEPIPATKEEYIAYRKAQEKLVHPNRFKKL